MQRDFSTLPRVVGADGKFDVPNANAVGFALEFVSGVGGFPVLVTLDNDLTTTFRVDGPNFHLQGSPLQRIQVDTTSAGGRPGDQWRVKLLPVVSDGQGVQLPRDKRGILKTAPVGGTELFYFDSRENPEALKAFMDAFDGSDISGTGEMTISVDPLNPGPSFVNTTSRTATWTPVFDLSGFSRVHYVMELQGTSDVFPGVSVLPFVHGVGPRGGWPTSEFQMGNVSEFGANWTFLGRNAAGSIEFGTPGPEVLESYRRITPRLPPFARFSLFIEDNGAGVLNLSRLLDGDVTWRLYAVGY